MIQPESESVAWLVGISGPATGMKLQLPAHFGRNAAGSLCLDDDAISRDAKVYASNGRVIARDLHSHNGTFINGARLPRGGEGILQHRDILKIDKSRWTLMEPQEPQAKMWLNVRNASRARRTVATDLGRFEDLLARADKNVGNALVAFGISLNRTRNSADMVTRTVDAIFDTVPAEKVAVLLLSGSAVYRELASESREAFEIDDFIRQRTLDHGLPVHANDEDSVLCVPIATENSTLGLIYTQHSDPEALDERHIVTLCGIAGFVGPALAGLLEREWLKTQLQIQESVHLHDGAIVGNSPQMQQIYLGIQKIAATDATVLITGENGTGKEVAAAAIHRKSRRAGKRFVVVDCGAITPELIHSELFGHERGSFTGATSQRIGKLEAANGGTVFLDEVGELSLSAQVSLLRFLQEHNFQRVGGNVTIHSDARVIAATNRNLEQMVRQGTFREDLYYRLRVVPMRMPSLAERGDDVPLLAAHFIQLRAAEMGKSVIGFTREAQELLKSHPWKGNVRELENAIIASLVFAEGEYIHARDIRGALEENLAIKRRSDDTLESFMERAERWLIESTLKDANGNVALAAQRLNVHPGTLYRRLEKLNIQTDPD